MLKFLPLCRGFLSRAGANGVEEIAACQKHVGQTAPAVLDA
jgi:hypothetical protein